MFDYRSILENEETLDPSDWDAMRTLAHEMVDDMFAYLEFIREEPVWRKPPESAKEQLRLPLPRQEEPIRQIYQEFKTNILPYTKGNIHPRFWSWVQGTGTPFAMMGEMLAAAMNPNVAIGDHAAMYVDEQVINWCKALLNYPAGASGILLSGGSMANITALQVARNSVGEADVRRYGVRATERPLVLYASTETHGCVKKAAEVCGLGAEAVRSVPVDADYRIDLNQLREMLAADRARGLQPFCVVGNAGTVNTGAIDPLDELLAICREEKLWFHVDGAFGALAKPVPEYARQLKAIEEADSLAFDLHKWLYLPYEVGCTLIKNPALHRAAFAAQPNYLLSHERGLAAGPDPITNYGMELSRGFKSLKVWMTFKEQGADKMVRLVRQNIAQAFYLGELIRQEPLLELATPVTLNIVCFRYRPPGLDDDALNAINKEILMRLHEEGLAAPSYTVLDGKYVMRVANVNHRSRKEDFEALLRDVLRIGQALEQA